MRRGEDLAREAPPKLPTSTEVPPTSTLKTSDTLGRAQETPPPRAEDPEAPRVLGGRLVRAVPRSTTTTSREGRVNASRQLGIIRTDDGRHLQAAIQPDGTPGFVVVNPAEIKRGLFQDVGTKISEAAVGDLNIHMRAVVRKIGLNPTARALSPPEYYPRCYTLILMYPSLGL